MFGKIHLFGKPAPKWGQLYLHSQEKSGWRKRSGERACDEPTWTRLPKYLTELPLWQVVGGSSGESHRQVARALFLSQPPENCLFPNSGLATAQTCCWLKVWDHPQPPRSDTNTLLMGKTLTVLCMWPYFVFLLCLYLLQTDLLP